MKITRVTSHILQYDLPGELGYSQQYYEKRSAHLVEVETDEGITGWGECFGPGNIAIANKSIVEKVIQPMVLGCDPMDRDVLWHKVYNLTRDHGQKGMPLQSLSGVDIALWDIAGKVTGQPLHKLVGGAHRTRIPAYGYGMMLKRESVDDHVSRFKTEAAAIMDMGFVGAKLKTGLGPREDILLCQAVAEAVEGRGRFMVDANHCYTTSDAFYVGRALDELGAYWFEEPVAPEDLDGYRELRRGLKVNISGGEAEFNRWGWRQILENRGLDIAQPEVCALGGISEYLRVLALCHAHFTPVINHVWGSAIAVATNIQLLAAMPALPGGLHPWEPMLEFDTTDNRFRDNLLEVPLDIQGQVKSSGGFVTIPDGPGLGVVPDRDFIRHYELDL
ncbi:mandelate racemase/muconate lactonizing enzyme family protein [Roseibium album]|uniref:L-rhamnonate dehydratase n=1 Tax=Roseibium album TaxID=311410 RepID=A0A0M7A5H9_9HYPH|nr:mandelate racemase/muconate lactonizing enzyme family protein [Roseibium album]MBG6160237.1 D-galactarolactone cycloisomerase [Labrenzia sp. EL_162]MBG6198769.1 D-galactarolactone cycloisomerase [Labrenzia sp. EL_159]CTQ63417.1 L-rhamnonate dehydratase [Roseibium album]CTQ69851.1 L-rhamnonate dehydratase [Roseibium album]CTQ81004.1 L-rhamnonate dehydratase [Roseibium album]